MVYRLTRISPTSLAKLYALLMFVVGLFVFIPTGLILILTKLTVFGVFFAVFLPLLYALIGYFSGFALALFFNFAAKKTGGLELEFSRSRNPKHSAPEVEHEV